MEIGRGQSITGFIYHVYCTYDNTLKMERVTNRRALLHEYFIFIWSFAEISLLFWASILKDLKDRLGLLSALETDPQR